MSNIKIIYYDPENLSQIWFENNFKNSRTPYTIIGEGVFLVYYKGSSKQLYEFLLQDSLLKENSTYDIFIAEIVDCKESYWGFMNKSVWDWLGDNISGLQKTK